ncbi:MAG: tRNA pseudouridine(38-40) synthase TruA [Treponema sp.]|jgi:tRNA pseudouridine38-40 synthase|nr:tRNA pseudouridine(38-40) synthase TruA [Treponema sp.]
MIRGVPADPALRNIKLILSYDGTDFSGFQRQGGSGKSRTVQGCLEEALKKIHKHPVNLTGSGRTDAGVHAAGQTANFYTRIRNMEASRFVPALNSLLPRDIRILNALEVPLSFHARFDAKSRTYRYHFICGRPALPTELRYNVQLWRRPRFEKLNDYARLLLGETDCSLFASPHDASKSRNRYISQAWFFVSGDALVFEITANAFLWKMVRSVTGTLLYCEERDVSIETLRDFIMNKNRNCAGPTLPPQGLFLWKIDYYPSPLV